MPKLTRNEFAKRCHVSKMAVSKAVRAGKVTEDDKGRVDTADPLNRAYLQADHAVAKRARAKGAASGEKVGRAAASKLAAKRAAEKHDQWMKEHAAKTAEMETRRARALKVLVERKAVENAMALFIKDWKIQIIDRMHAMVPTIYDKCTKGAPIEEAYQYVDKETAEAAKALIGRAESVSLPET